MNDAKQPADKSPEEIERIFALLEKGLGRELVTDANVDRLIDRAHAAGVNGKRRVDSDSEIAVQFSVM